MKVNMKKVNKSWLRGTGNWEYWWRAGRIG